MNLKEVLPYIGTEQLRERIRDFVEEQARELPLDMCCRHGGWPESDTLTVGDITECLWTRRRLSSHCRSTSMRAYRPAAAMSVFPSTSRQTSRFASIAPPAKSFFRAMTDDPVRARVRQSTPN